MRSGICVRAAAVASLFLFSCAHVFSQAAPSCTVLASPSSGQAPLTVNITVRCPSSFNGGSFSNSSLDFGDGTGTASSNSFFTVSHIYDRAGTFQVVDTAQYNTSTPPNSIQGTTTVTVTPAQGPAPAPGDVYISTGDFTGTIERRNPNGNFAQSFYVGQNDPLADIAFDSSQRFYVADVNAFSNSSSAQVYDFDASGNPHAFVQDSLSRPDALAFDSAGNLFVGGATSSCGSPLIAKVDSSGNQQALFSPAGGNTECTVVTSLDLASDQRTMFYLARAGNVIKRFDVSAGTQLADFATVTAATRSLIDVRIRPNGQVLAGDGGSFYLLAADGTLIQSFGSATSSANGSFVGIALDPDNATLWTGNSNGAVFRFDIATGNLISQFSTNFQSVGGIGVLGELRAAFVDSTPKCTLTATSNTGIAPFSTNFNGSCTDAGNDISSANSRATLDFGDNTAPQTISTANGGNFSNVSHTYQSPGTYTATYTVTDDNGHTGTATTVITVSQNQPPSCTLTLDKNSGTAPLTVNATATCSDPDGESVNSASINWGDGSASQSLSCDGSCRFTGAHTYSSPGSYTIVVSGTDAAGVSGSTSQTVMVTAPVDSTPNCTLSSSSNGGAAPFTANFNGSCTDAGNDISSANSTASLDFGDGTTPQQISTAAGGNFSNVSHVYQSAGSYTATYTVTDDSKHTGTATDVITVSANQPPTCTLQVNPSSGSAPLTVTATGNCTDPENDITSTSLNWGDGTVVNDATSGSHTYTQPGVYMVTVTATDSSNQQGSASQRVIVQPSQPPPPPQNGDVYASGGAGEVERYSPTGTLLQILDTGTNDQFLTGSAFDSAGNFYVTGFDAATVYRFDPNGKLLGKFGSGYSVSPESIVFDATGNAYVGQVNGTNQILKLDPSGNVVAQYSAPIENRGTDWVELGADHCTMYYTSEGKSIKRFDVCKNAALADFVTGLPGSAAFELRIRPNGEFLVADSEQILRLDGTGKIIQQYTAPNNQCWFALNLDPDNTSFWSADLCNNSIYHFDIATGNVITNFVSSGPNTSGLSIRGEIQVATNQPPTCSLSVNPTTGQAPLTVNATANCTDPENDIASASIDWGDQSTPQALTCNGTCTFTGPHTYSSPGTYTVVVTATDTGGLKGSANQTITVTQAVDSTPACTLNSDTQNGTAPLTVTFSGNCQDAGNDLGQGSTGTLNFGDNTTPQQVSPASFSNVSHIYQAAGTYTATFTATDSTQHTGSASRTITVTTAVNSTPMCTLNSDKQTGTAPLTVNFNGSCSDAGNDLIASTEKIDFGDGTAAQTGTSATHTYSQPGTYNATLSAADSSGNTGSTSETITVTARLPPACTLSVNPASGQVPLSVTATGSCAPGSSPIAATTLDFGDGTVQSGTSGSHTYSKAGNYTVTVTATDQNGLKGSASQTVSATAPAVAPTCTLSVTPASGQTPLSVTATGNCTAGSSPIVTTTLDFGDGTTLNASSGTHTYVQAGTFTAKITATDSSGLSGSASQVVTVGASSFPQGVFVGVSGGTIMQFAPDGTVLKTLSTGLGGTIADMAFDHAGTLYTVDFTAANISRFDLNSGTLLGTFGSGYNCQPESMVFDGAGNAYVGQQGCSRNILKLDPSGKLLTQYKVATEEQGSDDVDLSADQCTLLYTSEGPSILRYDVCRNQQMTPFTTSLKKALMLRILPDGGVIVADLFDIVRLDSSGKQVMTYTASGAQCLYGVALDQDGTSFWASDYCTSNIYRFDIASGNQISKFNTGTASGTVFGLAIAGSGLNVAGLGNGGTMTASPQSATLAAGQSATFTISFTPNATAAGKTLTLSCASLPPGLSCSFTPSTITLGAAGTTTTAMLTITRTTVAELRHPDAPWMFATWLGGIPAVVLIGLRWPRRRRSSLFWLGLIVASTGIWASCGGGSVSRATTPQSAPQGTYTVIVVGTTSGAEASTTVNLTLQ